jgi:hypothetical protein
MSTPAATADTETLPAYAPVPRSALGPALNEQGYYVGRVERNLYWVTDGTYQSAFLTTSDGVVLIDATPTIGNNIRRAHEDRFLKRRRQTRSAYLIYSPSTTVGVVTVRGRTSPLRRGTRRAAARGGDPARPPGGAFRDRPTPETGRAHQAWPGGRAARRQIIIHHSAPRLAHADRIVNPGWAPVYVSNLSEYIPGYIEAPANALAYSWKHFIGGHVGRLGTRDDVKLHQQYMADISESSRKAIDAVDPRRYYAHYGENKWAAARGHLEETTRLAAEPVIEKYTGVLAGADIFTESTAFWVMESIRLDLGYGSQVHP